MSPIICNKFETTITRCDSIQFHSDPKQNKTIPFVRIDTTPKNEPIRWLHLVLEWNGTVIYGHSRNLYFSFPFLSIVVSYRYTGAPTDRTQCTTPPCESPSSLDAQYIVDAPDHLYENWRSYEFTMFVSSKEASNGIPGKK